MRHHFISVQTANRACALLYSYIKDNNKGVWLLPVNICPDVPLTFCLARVPFEFIDINAETLCIDCIYCKKRILENRRKYAGLVFVRTYGCLDDVSVFFNELHSIDTNFKIIDDRCLCIPERNPEMFGADMVLYSTGRCKQIDLNEGGLAFYLEDVKYKIDPELRYDGTNEEIIYKEAYKNGVRLERIPEGWLSQLKYKDFFSYINTIERKREKRIETRNKLNRIYETNLPIEIQYPSRFQQWRFNIRVEAKTKDVILEKLFRNNLFASSHYHSANKLFDKNEYHISDSLYSSIINLFNDSNYTEEMAYDTCRVINSII